MTLGQKTLDKMLRAASAAAVRLTLLSSDTSHQCLSF